MSAISFRKTSVSCSEGNKLSIPGEHFVPKSQANIFILKLKFLSYYIQILLKTWRKVILIYILDWWVCKVAPQCLYKWSQFLLIFNYEIEIWQILSMQSWFLWRKPIKWLSSPQHPSFFEPTLGKLEKVYICDLSHGSVYFTSNFVFPSSIC